MRGSVAACSVPAPQLFRARAEVLQSADCTLMEWSSTPLAVTWHPRLLRPRICFSVLLSGAVQIGAGSASWRSGPGTVQAFRCVGPIRNELLGATRWRALLLPIDTLPLAFASSGALTGGAELGSSALARSFASLLRDGVGEALEAGRVPTGLVTGLRGIAEGVLGEVAERAAPDVLSVRGQIAAYVDRHLAEPDLGPGAIADEFGMSVRWVHKVFNGEGTTLAKFIRERRVDAVARFVRSTANPPRLSKLAAMFGFAGRDQLTRAFTVRYGMGVGEFLEAGPDVVPLQAVERD